MVKHLAMLHFLEGSLSTYPQSVYFLYTLRLSICVVSPCFSSSYTDDMQLYCSTPLSLHLPSFNDGKDQMVKVKLKLNDNKTETLLCSRRARSSLVRPSTLRRAKQPSPLHHLSERWYSSSLSTWPLTDMLQLSVMRYIKSSPSATFCP